jgi:NADPH-dependent 2,4-dienoyl-CoA reductase/sulfur reductase-like enzyme/rhodanese-related sulfurtransferase
MSKRVVIVGGVAGGASAAARLRRLDESLEILLFDRGPHVSFANCGLPYFVGDVIPEEGKLLVASRELFRDRFAIDVFTDHEVTAIDRAARTIRVRDLKAGVERDERWDDLVLAPGAAPFLPAAPGVDLPGVFVVRTIPDAQRIRAWMSDRAVRRAVVIGGGFIGLEMAENLIRRGLEVTVLEKMAQVMPPVDAEMAVYVARALRDRGVTLRLGEGFSGIAQVDDGLRVRTDLGGEVDADLVILALGVRPETSLARAAGLTLGARGGIAVDAQQRTSDPHIYAVGDAVEVRDVVLGQETVLPLAGPANRQGRVAADAIAGRAARFRGVQGTAIVEVLGVTVATTGASERGLRRAGRERLGVLWLHPGHHASYYPGAQPIHLKVVFDPGDGKLLGAQAVGTAGVDKRIDVVATLLQMGATVRDLAEVELCYAPQFGSAKDPVNLAGMMASNVLDGDMPLADWRALGEPGHALLDVRDPHEHATGAIPGAQHVPLNQLRARVGEIPRDRPVWVYCAAGQRAYFAQRLLRQRGVDARNLSGGYTTYLALRDSDQLG